MEALLQPIFMFVFFLGCVFFRISPQFHFHSISCAILDVEVNSSALVCV